VCCGVGCVLKCGVCVLWCVLCVCYGVGCVCVGVWGVCVVVWDVCVGRRFFVHFVPSDDYISTTFRGAINIYNETVT